MNINFKEFVNLDCLNLVKNEVLNAASLHLKLRLWQIQAIQMSNLGQFENKSESVTVCLIFRSFDSL